MSGLEVTVCRACAWRGFPARLWCPACGGGELDAVRASTGTLEERTILHKAPGRELAAPVALATVALVGGGRAVVRIEGDPAGEVSIDVEAGAPVARGGAGA